MAYCRRGRALLSLEEGAITVPGRDGKLETWDKGLKVGSHVMGPQTRDSHPTLRSEEAIHSIRPDVDLGPEVTGRREA